MGLKSMYIITRLEVTTNEVKIIEVFREKIDAINHLMSSVSELSKDESLDIIIINDSRIEIFKRTSAWFYGKYKDLEYVYQLSLHPEKDCVCGNCFFSRDE